MKIPKAIEILEKQRYSFPTDEMRVINDAHQLGIEALKAWREARKDPDFTIAPILPGETPE